MLVGSAAGRVWAVTPAGKVRWFHAGAWPVSAAPLPFADGSRRIAVAQRPELVILDAAGQQLAVRAAGRRRSAPGRSASGGLAALRRRPRQARSLSAATASHRWQRDLGSAVRSLACWPSSASVVALTEDGRAWRLAADGELLGRGQRQRALSRRRPRPAGSTCSSSRPTPRSGGSTAAPAEQRRLLELSDPAVAMLRLGRQGRGRLDRYHHRRRPGDLAGAGQRLSSFANSRRAAV